MNIFLPGILLFLIGGIVSIFFNEKIKGYVLLLFGIAAQAVILPPAFKVINTGVNLESIITFSEPIGNAVIRLDPLAAFFSIIISIGGLLASIYSIGYMKHYIGKKYPLSSYYLFFGVLITAMFSVVIIQNALLFLIAWELMSLSSFFLVSFENEKEEVRKAGIYYLIAMQVGVSCLIAAFAWTANLSGSFNFDSFKTALQSNNYLIIIFILFFIGFGMKAGFVPLHTWLPKAHPAAPTGVSAIMSGVMIKTGIYGILRIIILSGKPGIPLSYLVFAVSFVTGIIGILNSSTQKDIKKLLAYSSIENIGIIGMGIGLGMLGLSYQNNEIAFLGFLGALLHTLNHFTFKSVLFYGAGIVYQKSHTRNIEKLGGLIKFIPLTSVLFLISAIAISGLPLFNGFISEFSIYLGMAKSFSAANIALNISMIIGFSGLALIGVTAFISFTKLYGIAFLGLPRKEYFNDNETPGKVSVNPLLTTPMVILAGIIFMIGLFPYAVVPFFGTIITCLTNTNITNELNSITSIYYGMSNAFLIFGGMILFFFAVKEILLNNKKVTVFKTWDCGYQAESSKIQYTGSSYTMPFLNLVSGLVPKRASLESRLNLFPEEAHLETSVHDSTERYFIQPGIKLLQSFLKAFAWIQSGRMQQYILYGLIFLVILLIWIIGAM